MLYKCTVLFYCVRVCLNTQNVFAIEMNAISMSKKITPETYNITFSVDYMYIVEN